MLVLIGGEWAVGIIFAALPEGAGALRSIGFLFLLRCTHGNFVSC